MAFLRGDRFHTLQSADGTGFRSIAGLVAPPGGGLWLLADSGIVHIPESEIQSALAHPEHRVSYELFDLVSDLPEPLQHTGAYASGAIQDGDGLLWFATRSGAARWIHLIFTETLFHPQWQFDLSSPTKNRFLSLVLRSFPP